jgi:hypothetical protein
MTACSLRRPLSSLILKRYADALTTQYEVTYKRPEGKAGGAGGHRASRREAVCERVCSAVGDGRQLGPTVAGLAGGLFRAAV